jgi:hypothetical protein
MIRQVPEYGLQILNPPVPVMRARGFFVIQDGPFPSLALRDVFLPSSIRIQAEKNRDGPAYSLENPAKMLPPIPIRAPVEKLCHRCSFDLS